MGNILFPLFSLMIFIIITKFYFNVIDEIHCICKTSIIFMWIIIILLILTNNNAKLNRYGLIVEFIIITVLSMLKFKGDFKKKLLGVMLIYLSWNISKLIMYNTMVYIFNDFENVVIYKDFYITCTQIVMLILINSIQCLCVDDRNKSLNKRYLIIIFIPLISMCIIYIIYPLVKNIDLEYLINIRIILFLIIKLNIVSYYIFGVLFKRQKKHWFDLYFKISAKLFKRRIQEHEETMLDCYLRENRINRQIIYIKALLNENKYYYLEQYLNNILHENVNNNNIVNSGNILIDFILNYKCKLALDSGILCNITIEVPYKFPFSDGDIGIILENAIDNAIEATLQCKEEKFINIYIAYNKHNLFIKVSNSFNNTFKKKYCGKFINTNSFQKHGLGLKILKKAADNYNGLVNYKIKGKKFTLTVLLYS